MGGGTRRCHWSQMTSNRKTGTRPIARSGVILRARGPRRTSEGVPYRAPYNAGRNLPPNAGTEAFAIRPGAAHQSRGS